MKSNNNILSFLTITDLKKLHYVYIIYCTLTGEYYFGKHSTNRKRDNNYLGSGKELNKRKKEIGKQHFEIEYIARFETENEAYDREEDLIRPHISDIQCLNKTISSRSSKCNHSTYIYSSGKTALLHVHDPDVLSGLAVGVNKGIKHKPKTPEQKAIQSKNRSESQKRRRQNETPEQKVITSKKQSESAINVHTNKTPEEKVIESKNKSKAAIQRWENVTPEQKAIAVKNWKETIANKTPEQKVIESKNKSLAHTTKYTQEETDFILQQHYLGLKLPTITKLFNQKFKKPEDYLSIPAIKNHIQRNLVKR